MKNYDDFTDDLLNQGYTKGYEKGRADAIDDAIHHLDNCTVNCHEDYIDGIHFSIGVLKELKG